MVISLACMIWTIVIEAIVLDSFLQAQYYNNAWTIHKEVLCVLVMLQDCLYSVQIEVLMVGRLFKFYRRHADPSVKLLLTNSQPHTSQP